MYLILLCILQDSFSKNNYFFDKSFPPPSGSPTCTSTHTMPIEVGSNDTCGHSGDTIHLNDGTHLTGTVDPDMDAMWQEIYGNMIAGNLPLYDLPKGKEGNRFGHFCPDS